MGGGRRRRLSLGSGLLGLLTGCWVGPPSGLYAPRERAALAWTEALTLVSETRAPDDAYAAVQQQFTEEERVKLSLMINVINGWNRIAVGFGLFADPAEAKAIAQRAAA